MYKTPADNETLLHAAASAFRTATALHAEAVPASMRVDQQDGSMRFDLGAGGSCTLPVMVRRVVDRFAAVTPIVELQHRLGQKVLLVTSYVSPDMAERLRSHDIPFIDTAGNVSLRLPSALLYVVGRRAPAGGVPQRRARTASPKQLAVLFALIANPGLLNAPYRSIANAAGVALSTVNLALDDLLKRSLVGAGDDGKRRFIDWARVVDEWATLYPLRLRPKLASKRFSATRPDWWQGIDLQRYDAVLGSEAAAEKLAHNLRAERITLYAGSATPRELILDARLKADPGGEVEIVQRFWPAGLALATEVAPTVGHPVLVYADLLETGESRNVEAARQIREQYLAYPP
ncbi:type IV toxin-antitoxin system AbiEi family antitoxin [Cupriavidus alkaliphilus]|uniref:type IV toxin-antitoxin system AbiEi family antitoxin n=1 Tax=Cupriavidus alkaliphilus TaxID=942866 RepID=UPI000E30808E|nr:type IV toxin-antitoxin system AbiEi family antitoxin [Cupriavidus alkaliphilus]